MTQNTTGRRKAGMDPGTAQPQAVRQAEKDIFPERTSEARDVLYKHIP